MPTSSTVGSFTFAHFCQSSNKLRACCWSRANRLFLSGDRMGAKFSSGKILNRRVVRKRTKAHSALLAREPTPATRWAFEPPQISCHQPLPHLTDHQRAGWLLARGFQVFNLISIMLSRCLRTPGSTTSLLQRALKVKKLLRRIQYLFRL